MIDSYVSLLSLRGAPSGTLLWITTLNNVYYLCHFSSGWKLKGHKNICLDWTEVEITHGIKTGAIFQCMMKNDKGRFSHFHTSTVKSVTQVG